LDADAVRKMSLDEFWNGRMGHFKVLGRIAHSVLSVLASSIDVESLFSCAGSVVTRGRVRLSPRTAEEHILLSQWLRHNPDVRSMIPELLDPLHTMLMEEEVEDADVGTAGGAGATAVAGAGAGAKT